MLQELSTEQRTELTSMVITVLDDWGLDAAEQVEIMGLPAGTKRREITRLRNGGAVPGDSDVLERCRDILRIHNGLTVVFPHNPFLGAAWITDPGNRHFGKSPLEHILERGDAGLERVRDVVEGNERW